MKLKEIFAKPIDRSIEGVIKADDEAQLHIEVEEYVITREIEKRMSSFFESYNDYQGANGVWISGFFGSGKSHLLKMLAFLLENKIIGEKRIVDVFETKTDDALLKASMKKAVSIPSKSILFNIDQKADTIHKTETDAVLAVFNKVFNEMQGYYGKLGYVAQFERDLDNKGLYKNFKEEYEKVSGQSWIQGRETVIIEKVNIAEAFSKVSDTNAYEQRNIIDAYRDDFKLSIEDFAEQVKQYIDKQEKGFRLNFFIDEIGQYIADNVKLMTNLQTIAESLATICRGQSWLIVTSQEDMTTVLGDEDKQQNNDFTKIQDRFKTRMKLTSQDVAEVIKKRILLKNENGQKFCKQLYSQHKNHFGTLFDFADGAEKYPSFKNEQDFIDSYPFTSYQFSLFQKSIETLSKHSAFEGRHSSVGERSMLGVFQEVAIEISEKEIGELATFDFMFEGIRSALKSQIQRSVLNAENNVQNEFAVRVLKALFLVKYIQGFNATARNIRVLLQDNFDQDINKLNQDITNALNLLSNQTFIQRNGDSYEYLTDEEKDIEVEIKDVSIEQSDRREILENELFTRILKTKKIRHIESKIDFSFNKIIDDFKIGRGEDELSIHLISPFDDNPDNVAIHKSHSFGKSELRIVLPQSEKLYSDINQYLQTTKYIKQKSNVSKASVKAILHNISNKNQERRIEISAHIYELLKKSIYLVSGNQISITGENPKDIIERAFYQLISHAYPNLKMIIGRGYSEDSIEKYLDVSKGSFLNTDESEPEIELFGFIQMNINNGVRSTFKKLLDYYGKKPYGWDLVAVQCVVALLIGKGKLEARIDSNLLDRKELTNALKNQRLYPNLILTPQAEISQSEIRNFKNFYGDFFDEPAHGNEAKSLGKSAQDAFSELLEELNEFYYQKSSYPFLSILEDPIAEIKLLSTKDYAYFFEEFRSQEENLLDVKEDVIDPIRTFMKGSNRTIFDEASNFLALEQPNFNTLGSLKVVSLREILQDPKCYQGAHMRDAKRIVDELKEEIQQQLKEEKKQAYQKAERCHEKLEAIPQYNALSNEQKNEIHQSLTDFQYDINDQTTIAVIRDQARQYEAGEYNDLFNKIVEWTQEEEEEKIEYISLSSIKASFIKSVLEDEGDIEEYLTSLKEALLKAINDNKKIRF